MIESGCNDDHLAILNHVESFVNSNHAFCLLGNHEFNAIGWATQKEDGNWARPHTENNKKQDNTCWDKEVIARIKQEKTNT